MRFDDRLATVLRQPLAGQAIARIQFRQLVDLLGSADDNGDRSQTDAGFLRLSDLSEAIPPERRARILREPLVRLRNPRLVAHLARSEPQVAVAAIEVAQLSEEQWLDMIPALPIHARGFVRQRRNLGPGVELLLARLGIAERGLPPVSYGAPLAAPFGEQSAPALMPIAPETGLPAASELPEDGTPEPEKAAPPSPRIERGEAIGAIVRRIEEFRKARPAPIVTREAANDSDSPLLPLGDLGPDAAPHGDRAFDFGTDAEGRIAWCDRSFAPLVQGLRVTTSDPEAPLRGSLAVPFARRQPVRGEIVEIAGAPRIAGQWQVDATPRFERPGGAFVGYIGRMRRVAARVGVEHRIPPVDSEADRMRQVLHELRTPVNAIQGFAEVIQQQLFGPTPHEYRALAAAIASDSAHILAGFEELERLVKLDAGSMSLEEGSCDLGATVRSAIGLLASYTAPRGSSFELHAGEREGEDDLPPVAMAREDAEKLIWRVLATLAGSCAPGETIRLRLRNRGGMARLSIRLPAALADKDDDGLFYAAAGTSAQALSAGAFGSGFALRLARAEARAAGGHLERHGRKLRLELPAALREDVFNIAETNSVH